MTEYRAFDSRGAIIDTDDLTDTDSAMYWGFAVAKQGAVLLERKDGEDWVCFQAYRDLHAGEADRVSEG